VRTHRRRCIHSATSRRRTRAHVHACMYDAHARTSLPPIQSRKARAMHDDGSTSPVPPDTGTTCQLCARVCPCRDCSLKTLLRKCCPVCMCRARSTLLADNRLCQVCHVRVLSTVGTRSAGELEHARVHCRHTGEPYQLGLLRTRRPMMLQTCLINTVYLL
jgi:hypothetical protein